MGRYLNLSPFLTERINNGNPCNKHFRAYNADSSTTRRCCTGVSRDCSSCFDSWEHFSWTMINMKKHLGSLQDFTNWLTTMYVFYLINRLVDYQTGLDKLALILRLNRGRFNRVAAFGENEGNGVMVALALDSRDKVDLVYNKAIELGGTCEGEPGPRGDSEMNFYAGYFRDLDGNKLNAFCVG